MRNVGRPQRIDTDRIFKLRENGLTTTAIANEIGCTQGYVSRVLTSGGVNTGKDGGANSAARNNANTVVDHIINNGGKLREALQQLGLDVAACTVRSVAKDRGIDLVLYRHIGLEKGHWRVNRPYERRGTSGAASLVPVQCQQCKHEGSITWQQLSNRRAPACENCGAHC